MTSAMHSWHAYWRMGRLCPPLSLRNMSKPYGLISERRQCRTLRGSRHTLRFSCMASQGFSAAMNLAMGAVL